MEEGTLVCSRRGGHGTGLFSNCSTRLSDIVRYVNHHAKLPLKIDSSGMFKNFRDPKIKDIGAEYFDDPQNIDLNWQFSGAIDYDRRHQYINYQTLDHERLNPLIQKFFAPSDKVKGVIDKIETKYSLDYNNLCVVLYRGIDKMKETGMPQYEDFFWKAEQYANKNPETTFLIQSDETEFLEAGQARLKNSLVFYDEIKHLEKKSELVQSCIGEKRFKHMPNRLHTLHSSTKLEDSINYLAITYIMSRSKFLICGTGNCSIWPCLFRGNMDGVIQYCHGFYKEVGGLKKNFGVFHWNM